MLVVTFFLILCDFATNKLNASGKILDKYTKSPGSIYHGRFTRDIKDPHLLVPRRVFHDGNLETYFLPGYYDRREVDARRKRSINDDNEDKLHLVLPFNGIEHHVELTPFHDFISPEMVIEIRGKGIGSDLNKGLQFKRVSDHQCHYRGTVRGQKSSRAALSLCDGVVGYVHTNQGRYFIEPLHQAKPETDGQHVHVAYKRSAPHENDDTSEKFCGTNDNWEAAWAEQLERRERESSSLMMDHNETKRSEKASGGTHSVHRYIEAAIIADKKFLDFHKGTDYQQYLLTVLNMVSDFYHDSSVGNQIDFIVVRMVYLEQEKEEIDLTISPNADATLASFAKWAMKMNPESHTHPNHHDIAILITRYDICDEEENCGLMGLAYVSAVCDRQKAACINEDSGLVLGVVVAHEVGHTLGCAHDTEEISGCPSKDKDESYFLMSPFVFSYTFRWSTCSRKFITTLMDTGLGDCLTDDPKSPPDNFKYPNMLPGAMYGLDFQCNLLLNNSKACDKKGDCTSLWCQEGDQCLTNDSPPAEGTNCGTNKWCIHKQCVDIGSRPSAVNGVWGEWGPMSECSRTCGGGVKTMERECDKPAPSNGGRFCIGERKKYEICNTKPCDPSAPAFRAVQCSEFNKKKVKDDGLHTWTPYTKDKSKLCSLKCINEKKIYMELARVVKDGTSCKAGTNNMCISGVCRNIGCDWKLDSDAIEDTCGICKGTGVSCKHEQGDFTTEKLKNYQKVVTVPKGSTNIHMFERKPSENMLAIKLESANKYCLNGDLEEQLNGDYPCAGSIIIYTHPETDQEDLVIKGPISEDIQLQYAFFEKSNPGVHYDYYVKTGKTEQISNYAWEFLEWSECSAKCGGGTKKSEPTCLEEKGGKVSNDFCSNVPHPETKTQICNEQPCPSKWRVSQWSACNACDKKKGFRRRKVQCVKPGAHPGDDDVVTELKDCGGKSPKQKKDCIGSRPCKKTCKTRREIEHSEHHPLAPEEQHRLIDRFVDVSLMQYLQSHGNSFKAFKPEKRNTDEDYRHLLHNWIASDKAIGKHCVKKHIKKELTTPKPGSIIKDPVPRDKKVLIIAPYRENSLSSNLSDLAFQEAGDSGDISIDTEHKRIFTGKDAIDLENRIRHHNISQSELDKLGSSNDTNSVNVSVQ